MEISVFCKRYGQGARARDSRSDMGIFTQEQNHGARPQIHGRERLLPSERLGIKSLSQRKSGNIHGPRTPFRAVEVVFAHGNTDGGPSLAGYTLTTYQKRNKTCNVLMQQRPVMDLTLFIGRVFCENARQRQSK